MTPVSPFKRRLLIAAGITYLPAAEIWIA